MRSAELSMKKVVYISGELLEKMSGLEILDKLLQKCQATKIVTQVVILVSNLCCNANMNPQMTNTNILQTLLSK